jgi:hemoglobin
MRIRMTFVCLFAALSLMVACGGKTKTPDTGGGGGGASKSLYDRLGGKDAITAVVDQFVTNVAGDARINEFFKNADAKGLKAKLVDQICEASGGPCKYTGKNMKDAHAGMGVKSEHFDALVEDLVKALDQFKVGDQEKKDLLGALGPMKSDIVSQ